jgi:hypothetical protein
MRFEEYRRHDAVALAGLLSAGELLDMAIARGSCTSNMNAPALRSIRPR